MRGGNAIELQDICRSSGKSSLFFLTVWMSLESDCPEKGSDNWKSTLLLGVSGALRSILENWREQFPFCTWPYS